MNQDDYREIYILYHNNSQEAVKITFIRKMYLIYGSFRPMMWWSMLAALYGNNNFSIGY